MALPGGATQGDALLGAAMPGWALRGNARQGEVNMSNRLLFSGNIVGGNEGYRALAIAVVKQAIDDARGTGYKTDNSTRSHARYWLIKHGSAWLEAVGISIDQDWWENWIKNRFPKH